MTHQPPFDKNTLWGVCEVLGDTQQGLTGSEIGRLLKQCSIGDSSISTKRDRLFDALSAGQKQDQSANCVINFIQTAMEPVRFSEQHEKFEYLRGRLNKVLPYVSLILDGNGELQHVEAAKGFFAAQQRAGRLERKLRERGVHGDVLKFCKAELLQDNYFHAVFEATKSIADKIRDLSGLENDGAELVDKAFGMGTTGIPRLAFNSLQTETEKSEHKGLMNLLKGLFGTVRNTTAHAPKIKWKIDEQDALDILSFASLLHRRLHCYIDD